MSHHGDSETDGSTAMVPSGRRFSIHVCLGRGGFGEVYRATMASSGGVTSEVAVKILRADIDPGSEAVKRLRDEGRLLGALRHPAILRVHDLVILDRRVALVTEYVDGQDLDACIHASPPMPPRVLFSVVGEVASALNVAFNAPAPGQSSPMHLVHRDVKPANIRIGRHGEVKLLDFGIARAANMTREAHTANNAMMGSSHYMAPERFHEDDVFPPSDVYALGCIVFEGLTGERFFGDKSMKQIYGTMLSPRKYEEHLGERLQALGSQPQVVQSMVARLLAGDPQQRPDASEVAGAFEDLAEDTPGPTLKRWCRNREWPTSDAAHGSLSGRELDAQSFVSTRPPTPLPVGSPFDDPLASPGLLGGGDLLGAPGMFGEDPLAPVAGFGAPAPAPTPPPVAPQLEPPPVRPEPAPEEPPPPVAAEPLPPAHGLGESPGPLPRRGEDSMEAPMPRVATPLPADRVAPMPLSEPPVVVDALPPVQAALAPAPAPTPAPSAPPIAAPPPPPDAPSVTPATEVAAPAPPQKRREMPASIPRFDDEPGFPTPQPVRRTHGDTIAPGDFSNDEGDWLGDDPGPAPEPIAGVFDEPMVAFGSGDADDADFDRELEAMAARRAQRNRMVMLAVVAVAALVLLAGGGIYAAGLLGGDGGVTAAPATDPDPETTPKPEVAPAAGTDGEEAAADPALEPAPAPEPKAADKPTPKPAPKPAAAPAPAPKASAGALVDKGWSAVSGSPSKAMAYFEQALALKPGDAEASYGLGYALLQVGRGPEAKPHLCRALRNGSTQTKRDVQGMLGQNSMSCD